MTRDRWLLLPLAYTTLTRLTNIRGVLDHLTRDVAIPLITAIVVFGVDGRVALLLWLGFAVLYEVGYLVNDSAATAMELGGDRLAGMRVPLVPAVLLRLVVFAAIVTLVVTTEGWWVGATYLVVSLGVFAVLVLHTLVFTRSPAIRLFSFAVLSLTKYAPFLVPLIGWIHALPFIGSIFLMYGIPRTVHYVVRKVAVTPSPDEVRRFQLMAHGLGLLPGFIVVAPDLVALPGAGWTAPALLWVLYSVAWAAALISRSWRHDA